MKEQLSHENRETLAAYRYQRAQETLAEIPFLKQQGYYNTAVNAVLDQSLGQCTRNVGQAAGFCKGSRLAGSVKDSHFILLGCGP